jgi:hypothetical protein
MLQGPLYARAHRRTSTLASTSHCACIMRRLLPLRYAQKNLARLGLELQGDMHVQRQYRPAMVDTGDHWMMHMCVQTSNRALRVEGRRPKEDAAGPLSEATDQLQGLTFFGSAQSSVSFAKWLVDQSGNRNLESALLHESPRISSVEDPLLLALSYSYEDPLDAMLGLGVRGDPPVVDVSAIKLSR